MSQIEMRWLEVWLRMPLWQAHVIMAVPIVLAIGEDVRNIWNSLGEK